MSDWMHRPAWAVERSEAIINNISKVQPAQTGGGCEALSLMYWGEDLSCGHYLLCVLATAGESSNMVWCTAVCHGPTTTTGHRRRNSSSSSLQASSGGAEAGQAGRLELRTDMTMTQEPGLTTTYLYRLEQWRETVINLTELSPCPATRQLT